MPPLETTDLRQYALVWVPTGALDTWGQLVVAQTPVQLAVRWNDKFTEVLRPDGTTVSYDAQVITNVNVVVGSVMWLGQLTDIPGTTTTPSAGFFQVKTSNSTPDIKNRNKRFELNLMRLKDVLPTTG